MSRNTSPQSRATSGPRPSRGRLGKGSISEPAARVAHKAGAQSAARRRNAPTTLGGRIRRLGLIVGIPHVAAILSIIVIAFAVCLFTGVPMAWLPTAIAMCLMVVNLVPLSAGGVTISVVPALPALILGLLLAGRIRRAFATKATIKDLLICLAWVIGLPVVIVLVAWLMLWDAGKVYDVAPPSLLAALPRVVVLHGAAMVLGMGPKLWEALLSRYKVPVFVPHGATAAARIMMWLAAAGFAVVIVALPFSIGRQQEILNAYPNIDAPGIAALYVLSVLYLPNAVLNALAIIIGSELNFGGASLSLFSVHTVPFPPVPLLGLIPGQVHVWAPALMAIAMGVVLYVLIRSRVGFLHSLVAGVSAAALMAGAVYLGSGDLAAYGYVGPTFLSAVGLVAIWVAVLGVAAAAVFMFVLWRNGAVPSVAAAERRAEEQSNGSEGPDLDSEQESLTAAESHEATGDAGATVDGELVDEEAPRAEDALHAAAEDGDGRNPAVHRPGEEDESRGDLEEGSDTDGLADEVAEPESQAADPEALDAETPDAETPDAETPDAEIRDTETPADETRVEHPGLELPQEKPEKG